MVQAAQGTLFGHAPIHLDEALTGLRRIELADGAWIDHLPGWVEGHVELFESLKTSMAWRSVERAMYDRVVDVPRGLAVIPDDGAGHPILEHARAALGAKYGVDFLHIHLAYYRRGTDSVAMHKDRTTGDTIVPILSVGTPRRFVVRRIEGGATHHFMLGWGDLLVMGGRFQSAWEHGVPKVRQADPRISVMFRELRDPQ